MSPTKAFKINTSPQSFADVAEVGAHRTGVQAKVNPLKALAFIFVSFDPVAALILPRARHSLALQTAAPHLAAGDRRVAQPAMNFGTRASLSRRDFLQGAAGVGLSSMLTGAPQAASANEKIKYEEDPKANWPLWPALPLAPYANRKTLMREVVPGRVWTFDQLFGVFYVHVPIRMTVVAMDSGGLFVYAPVAPTKECLEMFAALVAKYGPVKHVVLPSVAPEHKVLAGPFARAAPCKGATFWTTDKQYSFPLNLPEIALGFPGEVKRLPPSSKGLDLWNGEFEHEVLTAKASKESVYQDAAFFHKPTNSLLVCDAVLATGVDPPEILLSTPEYRRALLYHARDDPLERVEDTLEVRRKGWHRIALFGNFFMPGSLFTLPDAQWIAAASKTPMPELGWAGALPFTWRDSTESAFKAFRNDGQPVVVPIIQIILSREKVIPAAREWLQTVTAWNFKRVIPAHFESPIEAGPKEFAGAFAFLNKDINVTPFCEEDVAFLNGALEALPKDLALFPSPIGPLRGKSCELEKGALPTPLS